MFGNIIIHKPKMLFRPKYRHFRFKSENRVTAEIVIFYKLFTEI